MFKKLLITACCFISINAFSDENETIKIAYSDFPPFEFKEGNSTLGLDAEIVTQVMARIGYKVEMQSYPWKRAMQLTQDGETDAIMSLRKSPEREELFIFADPISYTQNFFFKSKDLDIKANKIEELTNYNVGITNGYVYDKNFVQSSFPKISIVSADNPELVHLKKIASGRLDLAICEINVCSYLINNNKDLSNINYVNSIPVGKVENFYIAFTKKDSAKSNMLIQKFNAELEKFITEGKRDELIKKYKLVKLR